MLPFLRDESQIPVCIADLPAHDFQVSPYTLTEDVVMVLEDNPDLPGVLIVENRKLLGFLTRLKLFERLGHRYGIELFMRKPIAHLAAAMSSQVQPLPGHLRVDEAIQRALSRPLRDMYDPVVIQLSNDMFRILDLTVLVLAQSLIVSNLSNIVGRLGQLDALIYQDADERGILKRMLQLLAQVVPYHQAYVLVRGDRLELGAAWGVENPTLDFAQIESNAIYQMMLQHRQAIYLPDTRRVPAWQGMESLGQPASWLGVPLLYEESTCLGFLSLGRNVESPFTSDEKQTCQAFSQRMTRLLLQKRREKTFSDETIFFAPFETLEWADAESAF
ncbi:MAG: hypothetical protein DDG60_07845 [Anaerolineae bacterium]|nr:MAG: hypothetical protein DDG60_07845 [Anaerolineae bacterium]